MTEPSRLLVTGASGFVGTHLRAALRGAFPRARLIAATHGGAVPGWDETVPLDLADPASCRASVAAARPDAVVHLAAIAAVGDSFRAPLPVWQVNLMGTLALAEAVLATAPEAVFLHASSAEVYGLSFQDGVALAEDAALRPANPYAASKAAADLALGEMALRGLRTIRLRPFTHTGPGQTDAFVVPAFARQAARIAAGQQAPVLRVGALDRWRDFLDVRDVCAGYVAALRRADACPPGAAFNLASGNPRRVGDVLDDLLRLAGIAPRIETEAARLRPTDVERTVGDASAARAVLGWVPVVPWEDTLASVLAYWQARCAEAGG
ncbi:GDP-mannose 4,6-dehydratase [Plastoroseomonas hellenica]|uniref:GDP-mannose 4,6-dehydratase n=1 Tax=Plastoroseomonas hellenica TaxID=2687306 RepID=UPI001BA8A92C|nr:NAD-dependent epimerase/dehydratase family protein [Plastoroseomonas hellenica]